ncbi:hypothetical protein ACGVWS_04455 [Enterobacteriaceae bacterium LUAb1]
MMMKDKAASIIQHAYRNHVANKTRNDMVKKGICWQQDNKNLLNEVKSNINSLNAMKLTLNRDEQFFFERFMHTRFYATHATNAGVVDENDRLVLYSYRKLKEQAILASNHKNTECDINNFGNDDYVYFSLEAGTKLQKPSSRFGKAIYRIDFMHFNFCYADLLLVDQLLTFPRKNLAKNFREIFSETAMFTNSFNKFTIHFFNNKTSALQYIALNIIKLSRSLENNEIKNKLLAVTTDENINMIMNSIFRPEIRVPRMAIFENGQYRKKICF